MNREELLRAHKRELADRAEEIDPNNEYEWLSMSIGFFIAKGAQPEEAFELAVIERYGVGDGLGS